jgi:hypothetical protein
MRNLRSAICAIGGAKHRGIHAFTGNRIARCEKGRPGDSAFLVADRGVWGVFREEIESHPFLINEKRAEFVVLPEIDDCRARHGDNGGRLCDRRFCGHRSRRRSGLRRTGSDQ